MGAIVWGILVIVICPLLQIPVIVYIARHLEVESDTNQAANANTDTNAGPDSDATATIDAGRPHTPPTWHYWPEVGGHEPVQSFDDGSFGQTDSSTITCPHCGAENDRYYTYCRNCVARLPTIGAQ